MRRESFRIWLFLSLVSSFGEARAGMLQETLRGIRAQGMGGAFVAIADDEQAIFYNPAGMAGNEGIEFQPLGIDLTLSQDVVSGAETIKGVTKPSADTLNIFMGQNLFLQGTLTSTLLLPNLGVTALFDQQYALRMRNRTVPKTELLAQATSGVQAAVGWSVKRGRSASRRSRAQRRASTEDRVEEDFRVGVGLKILSRRGGNRELGLVDTLNLSTARVKELMGAFGAGYGLDLGTQYLKPTSERVTLLAGLAWTNIGATSFGDGPDPIPQNLSLGLGAQFKFGITRLTLAYDWRHLTAETDWRKKQHFGAELKLPMVSLLAGYAKNALSYGVIGDVWLARATLVTYMEENGSYLGQNPERRYALRVLISL
jgi:hypothetical protein